MSLNVGYLTADRENDELYSPYYVVDHIVKYLTKDKIIWCPFDEEWSAFYQRLCELGYKVVRSSLVEGQDFYTYEPDDHWDCIISNPPFTNKRRIFERALSFNKPFALIMSNTWLHDSAPKQLFKDKDLQLLMFDKRMKFMNNGEIQNKITFSSSYYCWNFLPKQIIIEELKIK